MEQASVSHASTPKNVKRYWSTSLLLMSLNGGALYTQDHVFTLAQFLTLTPVHVVEFFVLKFMEHINPMQMRSHSLEDHHY